MSQTMFGSDGKLVKSVEGMSYTARKRYVASLRVIERKYSKKRASCPWCLYVGTLDEFAQINEKTGEILKTFRCPDCGSQMMMHTTALLERGPANYSEWFWDQVFMYDGHDKISWEKLRPRVKDMGFDTIFWDVWRKMKGNRERRRVYRE